ncbi:hypothetical protein EON66_01795 [archaeon]|nr:MAG: hypothetical protein EON66_01795 [archaeon]
MGAGTRASSLAASSKLRNNILLLLSYLYIFHVVHPDLIGDLLKLLVARFHEVDSELLLLSLTHTGFQLRADDPVVLKDVLSSVLAKVKSLDDATAGSARVRVLSELILDVKNNRKRQSHEQAAERAAQLRKWLARLASKTSGVEGVDRRLRVTWADLMSISEKGRWWLVGASWVGRTAAGLTSSATATDEAAVDADGGILSAHTKHHDPTAAGAGRASEADAKLLALATKMRMNTAVRRSIFIAVMGADNAEAAMDRVLRLNLKGAAEREVIRVLMDCAGQEASYNPYYGALTVLLCTYNHHFKFTAQLAYWDAIKTFDDETTTPRRIYNLARLFAHLLCFGAVTLATLKVVDFTSMTPRMTLFVKAALIAVLLDVRTEEQVATIFTKLGNSSDRMMIRDGLSLFVHQHISGKALQQAAATRSAAGETVPQPAKLLSRLKVARRALDSVSAAATSGGTPADMLD